MSRSLEEWFGRNDDTPVPRRVRLRVLERFNFKCDPAEYAPGLSGCGRTIRPGDRWTCDHTKALINKGENRESNLHPLCEWCVVPKDASDVAEKSVTAAKQMMNYGIRKPRTITRWRKFNGDEVRAPRER